jgi:hypothetical protein
MDPNQNVPTWLSGAWKRFWIRDGDDGPTRSSVIVRNIQTPTLFGDVRVPDTRPSYSGATSLHDLSDAQLATLYDQQGFSGFTTVAPGHITTWHHEIDYQPPDGSTDIGRIELSEGRNMFEHGVEASYLEHWWYLESGGGSFFGFRVTRARPDGTTRTEAILSVAGDHFIYARNRKDDLPNANSLRDLIKSSGAGREQIIEILDCEVSHGFVEGGTFPWQIQLSTLPFKQGRTLDVVREVLADPKSGAVSHRKDGCGPQGDWAFPVNTLSKADLLQLFGGPVN